MADGSSDTETTPRRTSPGCWLAVSLALMLSSGILTVPLGGLAVMFTANCNDADDRVICSEVGGSLLFVGPIAGLIVGAVVSLVGAVMVRRRRHSLAPWLLVAWGVWAVGTAVPFVLTEQEQSAASQQREYAMYEEEEARRQAEAMAEYGARPALEEAGPRLEALRFEVDAALGPDVPLRWEPMEPRAAACDSPGQSLWLRAEVPQPQWPQWPAIADAISTVAGAHQMRDMTAREQQPNGERFFVDPDGSQLSARINDESRAVVLYSDCRLTAEHKANPPR